MQEISLSHAGLVIHKSACRAQTPVISDGQWNVNRILMIFSTTHKQVLLLVWIFSGFALALFSSTEMCDLSNQ